MRGLLWLTVVVISAYVVVGAEVVARGTKTSPTHSFTGSEENSQYWTFKSQSKATNPAFYRLTDASPRVSGSLWNTEKMMSSDWETTVGFRVFGEATSYGEGIALWYADDPTKEGMLFGYSEMFSGLLVAVFTNENLPLIQGFVCNGTRSFKRIGSCQYNFRGETPTSYLKVQYSSTHLSVHLSFLGSDLVKCFDAPLTLPNGYYLGVTASTTETLLDTHDIYSLLTTELRPVPVLNPHAASPKNRQEPRRLTAEERKKTKEQDQKIKGQVNELTKTLATHSRNLDGLDEMRNIRFPTTGSFDKSLRNLSVINYQDRFYTFRLLLEPVVGSLQKSLDTFTAVATETKQLADQVANMKANLKSTTANVKRAFGTDSQWSYSFWALILVLELTLIAVVFVIKTKKPELSLSSH
ncbi:vesicular integral-membrane protein VIP36 [Pelomyxa schiedti]|nr:vesicular integral-membrane protein VIP36 [Pelomyxa schiedti]